MTTLDLSLHCCVCMMLCLADDVCMTVLLSVPGGHASKLHATSAEELSSGPSIEMSDMSQEVVEVTVHQGESITGAGVPVAQASP